MRPARDKGPGGAGTGQERTPDKRGRAAETRQASHPSGWGAGTRYDGFYHVAERGHATGEAVSEQRDRLAALFLGGRRRHRHRRNPSRCKCAPRAHAIAKARGTCPDSKHVLLLHHAACRGADKGAGRSSGDRRASGEGEPGAGGLFGPSGAPARQQGRQLGLRTALLRRAPWPAATLAFQRRAAGADGPATVCRLRVARAKAW